MTGIDTLNRSRAVPTLAALLVLACTDISFSAGPTEWDLRDRKAIGWDTIAKATAHNVAGLEHLAEKRYDEALEAFRAAWETNPNHLWSRYNAACAAALSGDADQALTQLKTLSQKGGYRVRALLREARRDPDLVGLKGNPAFDTLTSLDAPPDVYATAWAHEYQDDDGEPHRLELAASRLSGRVYSDPDERLCVFVTYATDGRPATMMALNALPRIRFDLYDCGEPKALRHKFFGRNRDLPGTPATHRRYQAAIREADAWLQTHGMVAWERLKRGAPSTAARELFIRHEARRGPDPESASALFDEAWEMAQLAGLFASPRGRWFALLREEWSPGHADLYPITRLVLPTKEMRDRGATTRQAAGAPATMSDRITDLAEEALVAAGEVPEDVLVHASVHPALPGVVLVIAEFEAEPEDGLEARSASHVYALLERGDTLKVGPQLAAGDTATLELVRAGARWELHVTAGEAAVAGCAYEARERLIYVPDRAQGLKRAFQLKVFERFRRLDPETGDLGPPQTLTITLEPRIEGGATLILARGAQEGPDATGEGRARYRFDPEQRRYDLVGESTLPEQHGCFL